MVHPSAQIHFCKVKCKQGARWECPWKGGRPPGGGVSLPPLPSFATPFFPSYPPRISRGARFIRPRGGIASDSQPRCGCLRSSLVPQAGIRNWGGVCVCVCVFFPILSFSTGLSVVWWPWLGRAPGGQRLRCCATGTALQVLAQHTGAAVLAGGVVVVIFCP